MGSAPSGFDVLAQAAPAAARQQQEIAEQNKLARQAKLSAIVGDSLNALPLPKDEKGNPDINNPAYQDILSRRQKLIGSLMDEYTPVQHANVIQRIGGLITGNKQHAMPHPNQSLPAMGTGPAALAAQAGGEQAAQAQQDLVAGQAPPQQAAAPPAPPHPMAPLPADHPANKITEGLAALKNHLQAFAHPNIPKPDQSGLINNIAASYQDPAQLAFERQKELWGVRGQNALELQDKKNEYLKAMLQARPPRLLSQTTIPDLLEQMKVDPTMNIYAPDGHEVSPAQLAEMPPGTIAREFRAGTQIFYALGDQNSKTLNVNGQIYDIPAVGEVNIAGPKQNSSVVGQTTSTLPKQGSSVDQYGNVTSSTHITAVPPVSSAAPPPPGTPAEPTLLTRPTVPNPGARAPGTQPAGGAVKAGPVSANAPAMPKNLPPLDADGNIPVGVGNPQVRQFANDLLNDRDVDKIPPKARAAAEAMARPYGWEQGKFTPQQLTQIQESKQLIDSVVKDPTFNAIYSANPLKRGLISSRIHGSTPTTAMEGAKQALLNEALSPNEVSFIKTYQNLVGRINGLAQLTRGGNRSSEQAVKRMIAELPDPALISSPEEARKSFALVQNEIDIALKKRQFSNTTPPSVSSNAPKSPGGQTLADRLNEALGK